MAQSRPSVLSAAVRRVRSLALIVVALFPVGCDTGEPELPGGVEGLVISEGIPLAGVTVELTGAFNRVTETDGMGRYGFPEIPAGAYVLSIRNVPPDAAFPAISRTAVVVPGGTQQVDFLGNFIRTGVISGLIRSRGRGLGGVKVRLSGPDTAVQFTRSDGTFAFSALRAGPYVVEISDFPSSIRFPGTVSEVDLQPGQQHEMRFDGVADLTATVAIERIDQILADGRRVPADRLRARETLEITAMVEPGRDSVESVTLLLGGIEVASQQFGQGNGETEGPSMAGAVGSPIRVVFPVTTDAFDSRTGLPRWYNGEVLVAVRVSTVEGGSGAAGAQAQIRLENQDTFVGRPVAVTGPVLGADGRLWTGGGLQVDVIPVTYNRLRGLSSLTVDLWDGSGGGLVSRASWSGGGALRLTFPLEGPSGLRNYVTRASAGDRLLLVDARDASGQLFSGLPLLLAADIRLDLAPPEVEAFRLPAPRTGSDCCLDQWVGASFRFADALTGAVDPGVGRPTIRIHAGPAGSSEAALLDRPPVVQGADLAPSSGTGAYRAVAVVEDGLQNRRVVSLVTSGLGGTTFGVDVTPPTVALVEGPNVAPRQVVNPDPDGFWAFSARDTVSGIAPLPLRTTLRRWGPGDPEAGQCLRAGSEVPESACLPLATGLFQPVPRTFDGAGYFRLRTRAVDRAGNVSAPEDVWALLDTTPPEISSLFVVSNTGPGGTVTLGMDLRDQVDLHQVEGHLRFTREGPPGAPVSLRIPAPVPPTGIGTPFVLPRTAEASIEKVLPFLAALQRVSSTGAPTGALLGPAAAEVRVVDAARLEAVRSVPLPAVDLTGVRGFESAARPPAEAILRWSVDASVMNPAPDGAPRLRIRATATGDAEAFLPSALAQVHMLSVGLGSAPGTGWMGSVTAGELQTAAGSGAREVVWTLEWSVPPHLRGTDLEIAALGVDRAGVGLLTSAVTVRIPPGQ
jgi:hypothetical protein